MRCLPFKHLSISLVGLWVSLFSLCAQGVDVKATDSLRAQFLFEQGMMALHTDKPSLAYHLLSNSFFYSPSAATAHALAELTQGRISARSYAWAQKAFELLPSEQRYMHTYVNALLQKQEWREAIEALERYRLYAPTEVEAAMLLTEIYIVAGKVDKAEQLFEKMSPHMQDTPYEEVMHQIRFKLLQAKGADRKEVRLYAEELLKSQIKENPEKSIEGLSQLLSLGDTEGVREILNRLSEEERFLPPCALIATSAYMIEGRRTEACNELLRLIGSRQLSPDELLAAILPLLQQETSKGVLFKEYNPVYETLLSLHPDKYDFHASYVPQLYAQGDTEGAVKYLYKLTQLFPKDHPEIWGALVEERLMKDDIAGAEHLIEEGLQQYPNDPSLIVYRGLIRTAEEKYDLAEQLFQKALQLTPPEERSTRAEILSHLGDLYYAQEREEQAFEHYEQALVEDPKQVNVLNNYAYYLAIKGIELEKAARMAAQAVALQPEAPYILDTYGYILYLQKNYTLAEIYLRKAIENSADNPQSRFTYLMHHSVVLEEMGKVDEAIEWLEKELTTAPNEEIRVRIEHLKKLQR